MAGADPASDLENGPQRRGDIGKPVATTRHHLRKVVLCLADGFGLDITSSIDENSRDEFEAHPGGNCPFDP